VGPSSLPATMLYRMRHPGARPSQPPPPGSFSPRGSPHPPALPASLLSHNLPGRPCPGAGADPCAARHQQPGHQRCRPGVG
jgi:hypothetical protein